MDRIIGTVSSQSRKRLLPLIAIISFLIWPSVCLPSYLIELRNSGRFITYQYWEEKGRIRFYYSGGTVAFEKNAIKTIIESDAIYMEEPDTAEKSEPAPAINESKTALKTEPSSDAAKDKKVDGKILEDIYLFKERIKEVDSMENQALYTFANDLTGFRNKLLAEGLGHTYSNQLLDIYSMFDTIENTLKERGQ